MSLSVHHDPDRNLLFMTVTGPVTRDLVMTCYQRLVESPDWPSDTDVLWDARAADMSAIDSRFQQEITDYRRSINHLRRDGKLAILVGSVGDEMLAKLFRIFSHGVSGEVEVFRDPDLAEAWLVGRPRQGMASSPPGN